MAQILPFKPHKTKHRGNTLCRNGHHRWQLDKHTVFDTKRGRLVTRWRCLRCGHFKVRAC